MRDVDVDGSTYERLGMAEEAARALAVSQARLEDATAREGAWQMLTRPRSGVPSGDLRPRLTRDVPFAVHSHIYWSYQRRSDPSGGPFAAWSPTPEERARTNLGRLLAERGLADYAAFHAWSVERREAFWQLMIERLRIRFRTPPARILGPREGDPAGRRPCWLAGGRWNLADSCFAADSTATAILARSERHPDELTAIPYAELDRLSNRVAWGLAALGLVPGQAVGVCLPLTPAAVALFLGLLKAGVVCIGIADSFAAEEIAMRLRLGGAVAAFTQDVIARGGKTLPLYARLVEAGAPRTVVIPAAEATPRPWLRADGDAGPDGGASGDGRDVAAGAGSSRLAPPLRDGDLAWEDFLGPLGAAFAAVERGPDDATTILFSSGTTGEPKAIPWTNTTPLKCAVDAYLHHDVQPGDVLAWPTSLGWMMGPWLIYAALVNRATIALYDGLPTSPGFCRFVADARVTMLGVVPSLVAAWRRGRATEGVDWSAIRLFSSTGECSNQDDMLWLMAEAGYRPVIEYMGGTEIGGGYLTGTLVQGAAPGTFTTPACGLDIVILDEDGDEAENGEVFIVGPSIGLSQTLLNRDHDEVYYADCPAGPRGEPLRRHGDQVERLAGWGFRAHGRVDDTMKLGGVKVSSAELERVIATVSPVREAAAIAVPPPGGGPSELVVYVVLEASSAVGLAELRGRCQQALRDKLNPLFKIAELRAVPELPRTASNKVMRRLLRARYLAERPGEG